MKHANLPRLAVAACLCGLAIGCLAPKMQATPQEQAHASNTSGIALMLPSQPPKGAVVLFGGKADHVGENWYGRYGKEVPKWKVSGDGVLSPAGSDITSKQEFGDCYLHVEFRTPEGHGNSGVGMQGRYEIQIMNSHGPKTEANGAGSLYSQKPAKVNASRKAGEWQTFDIIFRAPRLDNAGQAVEKPRATVFHNGVLIHNNEEFTGMTGIQYGEYKSMAKTGPIVLQGDHDPVQFRNIWIVPM